MTPVRVHLHIDTLALPAHTVGSRTRVAAALEWELQRSLRMPGAQMDFASRSIAKLDAGSFNAPTGASDQVIGYRMARRIFGGIAGRPVNQADRHG